MDRIELLRLFVSIAEAGSLSTVARQQAIAPSTVTLGLKRLEEQVHARLVARTTRRVALTSEGDRFLLDCRRILADYDDAMLPVDDRGPLSGALRVTAPNDLGRNYIAPRLDRFLALHPAVSVELLLTDRVVELVDEGFDLGIRTGSRRDTQLVARRILSGHRVVCAAPDYWQARGRPEHPRDLRHHNCLTLTRPGAPLRSWSFVDNGVPLSIRITGNRSANDGEVLRNWAVAGAGVIQKLHRDVEHELASGALVSVLDDYAVSGVDVYALYPEVRRPPRRLLTLLDFLVDAPG